MNNVSYDVVIVGASIAGAASAILLARQGLRILSIDQKQSSEDYKKACTTFIQRSALPVICKLGLKERLDAAGAIQNDAEIWTKYGWVRDTIKGDLTTAHGYSVRRKILDPLMLKLMQEEPNIKLTLGASLKALLPDAHGNFRSIEWTDASQEQHMAHAKLVVLADGRNSLGAIMADVPTKKRNNNRFVYFSYYKNMPLKTGKKAQFWQVGKDMAFAYPFDGELTMLCSFICAEDHHKWAADRRDMLEAFFKKLPDSPDQSKAIPTSDIYGMRKLHDYWRPASYRGLALVGDACMSCDPMSGVGCGFALQAADWMASAVGPSLISNTNLEKALGSYAKKHKEALGGHEYFIQDASQAREANFMERTISKAAVQDPVVAHRLHLFIGRVLKWHEFLTLNTIGRILLANLLRSFNQFKKIKHAHK